MSMRFYSLIVVTAAAAVLVGCDTERSKPVGPSTRFEALVDFGGWIDRPDDLDALAWKPSRLRRPREQPGFLRPPAQRVVDPFTGRALARRDDDPERVHRQRPDASASRRRHAPGNRTGFVVGKPRMPLCANT